MEQQILAWIAQYGYAAIFGLLVFGIVGLPVPDETLLTFSGLPGFQGHISLPLAYGAALAGSLCGITISYTLGRTFGLALIHRYGKYLRITEEHVQQGARVVRPSGPLGADVRIFRARRAAPHGLRRGHERRGAAPVRAVRL